MINDIVIKVQFNIGLKLFLYKNYLFLDSSIRWINRDFQHLSSFYPSNNYIINGSMFRNNCFSKIISYMKAPVETQI